MTYADTVPSASGPRVRDLLRAPFTVVWLVLIAATLASWYLGTDHGFSSTAATTVVVMLVAFAKVRLVGLYFMELRDAPLPLRLVFEGYCVAACGAVLGIYLFA